MSELFAVLQAVIRGVCSIIDAFHFSISAQLPASADSPLPAEAAASADHAAEEQDEGDQAAAEAESAHRDIQSALTRRVLPSLRSQLVQDGEVQFHMATKSRTTMTGFCHRKERFPIPVDCCSLPLQLPATATNWCSMVRYSSIAAVCVLQVPEVNVLKCIYSCCVCVASNCHTAA